MKKLFVIILLAFATNAYSQDDAIVEKPIVDDRVELLSIVFRLAGNQEYNSTKFKHYTDEIESYFRPYENHELITFCRELHKKKSIGFDAVMRMAISINQRPKFRLLVSFSKSDLNGRWEKKDAEKFIKLLNRFYMDAHCERFFEKHKDLYISSPERFSKVYNHLDVNWYEKFYGKKLNENFSIINSLSNGGSNYSTSIQFKKGDKTIYAIIGTWTVDILGLPSYE